MSISFCEAWVLAAGRVLACHHTGDDAERLGAFGRSSERTNVSRGAVQDLAGFGEVDNAARQGERLSLNVGHDDSPSVASDEDATQGKYIIPQNRRGELAKPRASDLQGGR